MDRTAPEIHRTPFLYYAASSLDGYLADEHDDLSWLLEQPLGGGSLLDYDAFYDRVGALAMGRTTYQWVLDHPEAQFEATGGWPYDKPAFVFTHQDLAPAAEGVTRLTGAPSAHRDRLESAADGRAVWVLGGGDLATAFARDGMLDEVLVSIAPVALGAGRPLLGGRLDLELLETGRNQGFLEARYAVRGPAGRGSRS